MTVVTRFAPSPTGYLHIGGARTALFNWLFAKHHGGKYLLRIEDTDRARSTQPAIEAILDGLSWLGLDWDGEVVYQFERAARHAEVAKQMLAEGKAYHCYASPQELDEMRAAQKKAGLPMRYDGRWRDRRPADAPSGVAPVIRLRAPQSGKTVIQDAVQGEVTVENAQLDDMILLRADGTPTYMLAVVVDDQDMGVTHVIRGDDHLNNAFRQLQIIKAMGWPEPVYAHIPLIHGPDGAKLSKRHGALGVDAYRDMGFLPAALRNYLLRLGWGHGDDEIIPTEQAIEWFDLSGIGRAPAQFDFAKLDSINAHYIREADDARLLGLVAERLETEFGRPLSQTERERLLKAMPGLKPRAKTIVELAEKARFYVAPRPIHPAPDAAKLLSGEARQLLTALEDALADAEWEAAPLEQKLRDFATAKGVKLGTVAQPLRAALTGTTASPGIFEVMEVLGREEALGRIADAALEPA